MNFTLIKGLPGWRNFAAWLFTGAMLTSLAAAADGQPAAAATRPPSAVARVAVGAALQQQLLRLYAAHRHIPAADMAGVTSGSVRGARSGNGTDWVSIGFRPSPRAPLSAMTGFQDGGRYGIFTRRPGGAWRFAGLGGEPFGCGAGLPAPVRLAWHLAACPASAGARPSASFGPAPAGTTADVAKIADAQINVSDNPPDPNFSGSLDCDPYTTLVGGGGTQSGCGRTSNSPWFSNVLDKSEFWCADFAKWVWEKAGVTKDLGTLTPAAASFYTWGVQQGEHIGFGGTPKVGDAVIFYPPGTSAPNGGYADHVGLVTAVHSDGLVDLVNGDIGNDHNVSVEYAQHTSITAWGDDFEQGGERWALVSPKLKTSVQLTADVPSGPAVFDPLSGTLEVYGSGTDGKLEESYWSPNNGWKTLELTGTPPVTGRPSAVYDPLGKNLEVYATGTDGALEEYYYAPGKGWRFQELAAPTSAHLTGSPSAIYDPLSNNLEIYGTASGGNLDEFYWSPGKGWRTQQLTGAPSPLASSPTAMFDPLSKTMEVYGTGANGDLEEYFWTPANGWKTVQQTPPTSAKLTGTPAVVYDPLGNNEEVYATGSDGDLEELYYAPGKGWRSQQLTGAPSALTGSPTAVYDPLSKVLEVYGTGANGDLEEYYWTPANGWKSGQQTSSAFSAISPSPFAVYDSAGQHLEVYALTGSTTLAEYYYAPGDGWKSQTLPDGKLAGL